MERWHSKVIALASIGVILFICTALPIKVTISLVIQMYYVKLGNRAYIRMWSFCRILKYMKLFQAEPIE